MSVIRLAIFLLLSNFFVFFTNAASVTCTFMSETVISRDGVWIKSEMDFMKLFELFGEGGLTLDLENSLLAKLDSQEVFLAGETGLGKVYLRGSEIGIEGKNIKIEGEFITMYDGMCDVSFGN
tara:strand:- start:285 stop:653 length:369 start_codon:yes stop_codon:yes gene_type:complete